MMKRESSNLVLASASPFRRDLQATFGLRFTIDVSGVDEDSFTAGDPGGMVGELAIRKAVAVARMRSNGLVIAANTTV